MKKINKFLLLAILLLLFLSNCQKKEKNQKMSKIENESEQIFDDVSSDKLLELDNMSEEEKKELLENVMNYIQLQKLLAKRLNIVINY